MESKLVSIIIPVFNVGSYIEECVESILNQSYTNIEILLIDDGSTDDSVEKIKRYKDNRIKLFEQEENRGQAAARNIGLDNALGDYYLFVDSDDYIRDDAVEILVKNFIKFDVDFIRFNAISYFENEKKFVVEKAYDTSRFLSDKKLYTGKTLQDIYLSFLPSPVLYMFKSSIKFNNSVRFDEGIIHEDELFNTKLYLNIKRAKFVNENLYTRRYRDNSTMTNKNIKHLLYSFNSYMYIIDQYEKLLSTDSLSSEKTNFIKYRINIIYNILFFVEVDDSIKKNAIDQLKNKKIYFTNIYKIYIQSKKLMLIFKNKFLL